jgi:hypothetical protein
MKEKKVKYALGARMLIVALFAFLLLPMLQPAYSEETADYAKEFLSKSVKAIGGQKKACEWITRIDKGVLTSIRPGWGTLRAKCIQFIKKPGKMKIDQDYSAFDHPFFYVWYFNEGEAWIMVNLTVRQHPRYTSLLAKRMRTIDGVAYYLAKCDTFFVVKDIPSDSLISAAEIERVGVVDKGDTVFFDLSKETHLPLRRIEDQLSTHVILDDYRDTNGLKVPYHVTVYQGGVKSTEYEWEDIEFGEEIDDAVFEEYQPSPKQSD